MDFSLILCGEKNFYRTAILLFRPSSHLFLPSPFQCAEQSQGLATALRFIGIAAHALLCICHLPTVG